MSHTGSHTRGAQLAHLFATNGEDVEDFALADVVHDLVRDGFARVCEQGRANSQGFAVSSRRIRKFADRDRKDSRSVHGGSLPLCVNLRMGAVGSPLTESARGQLLAFRLAWGVSLKSSARSRRRSEPILIESLRRNGRELRGQLLDGAAAWDLQI